MNVYTSRVKDRQLRSEETSLKRVNNPFQTQNVWIEANPFLEQMFPDLSRDE